MFWNPLTLSIITVQIAALILVLKATYTYFIVVLNWNCSSNDRQQLLLETNVEQASIQGKAAFFLYLLALFLLILGIANVFPDIIPGAMCGTGVCQAMQTGSARMLLYHGLLLLIMKLWYDHDAYNKMTTNMSLTALSGRIFLLILPVALLTLKSFYTAFASIRQHQPVNCCTIVYDQFSSLKQTWTIVSLHEDFWIVSFFILTLVLLTSIFMSQRTHKTVMNQRFLSVVCFLWLPTAVLTLIYVWSAYHYKVLHHHCPWCLFLSEHYLVGYPFYGTLLIIAMESFSLFFQPWLTKQEDVELIRPFDRSSRAVSRILISTIIFFILATGPAMLWRLKYGIGIFG